jgi:peptidyl-prolyl cis-trans isomerase B (cyclophilin B)
MARSAAPDSASSQLFIVLKDYPSLDRQYTAFGEVIKGMDIVDHIAAVSNPDLANFSLGKPRAYQKLVKVDIFEGNAAPAAPPASDKKG